MISVGLGWMPRFAIAPLGLTTECCTKFKPQKVENAALKNYSVRLPLHSKFESVGVSN